MSDLVLKALLEAGFGALPADKLRELHVGLTAEFELSVGERMSSTMSDAELDEFETLRAGLPDQVVAWLEGSVPSSAWQPLLDHVLATESQEAWAHLVDLTAMWWLEQHRPDYRDVVHSEFGKLLASLKASADVFLDPHDDEER